MARGSSGRVVVEIGPQLKKQLYSVLSAHGLTLKDWFIHAAQAQVREHEQPSLFPDPDGLTARDSSANRG